MRLTLTGIGPAEGFPLDGCPCSACSRARRDGREVRPARLESSDGWALGVDGQVQSSPDVFEVAAGVVVVRVGELGTIVWAPQVGEPDDAVVESLAEHLGGEQPAAVFLGPVPNAESDDGEMPSVGCARTLARLRARKLIGPATRCVLVGFGHRESHPARLAACLPVWGAELGVAGSVLEVSAPQKPSVGRVLVLGGSGSGKSAFAEQMLSAAPEVVYLATGPKPVDAAEPAEGEEALPTEHPEDDEWTARAS